MKITSELFLTFLLNACWQIALIAAVAMLGDWLLRHSAASYRHFLWIAALVMSLLLPLFPSLSSLRGLFIAAPTPALTIEPLAVVDAPAPISETITTGAGSIYHINQIVAVILLALYALFLGYRGIKLFRAWVRTRAVARGAQPLQLTDEVQTIVARCQKAIGVDKLAFFSSSAVSVPATLGNLRPLVILPEGLLHESNRDALTAAIGHELVHVSRRDYLLNLICELIFLPLSFHPAAALIKRRITQTRELRCDELVAERLLHPEVYARSLLQLAGSAVSFTRRAQTITVGIADADNLEVRIMSLLKRTKLKVGRKKIWLIAAALLLAIPCVAAASFTFHFNVDSSSRSLNSQEPSREAQEKREARAREEREMKERAEREDQELRERIEKETNPEIKAKLEAVLKRRQEERAGAGYTVEGRTYLRGGEGAEREREIEAQQKVELARLARISMDQAIQIATSQQPGKVLECSLNGEHWEAPGKLAKDGTVFYHVVILSGDDSNPTTTHVLVNAVDGTILKLKARERSEGWAIRAGEREPIHGGVLNGKAVNLPAPEYPAIARSAHASGSVTVAITVDEEGNVVAAKAVSGHPLLQAAAVSAAREAKFTPTRLEGEPVKVSGVIIYNFAAQ